MNDGLNPSQREIAEMLDGMVVVDAGPGTGKTHTIVQRYVNLVSKEDVSPSDILMLTFTKNAASEMEDRIRSRLTEKGMREESKFIHVKTFDAFCLSVVMESPEETGSLFGIEEKLTHAEKAHLRFIRRVRRALEEEAVASLKRAKRGHDALEALYRPCVDFDAVGALCDAEIARIGAYPA